VYATEQQGEVKWHVKTKLKLKCLGKRLGLPKSSEKTPTRGAKPAYVKKAGHVFVEVFMALLDLHSTPVIPLVAKREPALPIHWPTKIQILYRTALDNPLLLALLFGSIWHCIHMGLYRAGHHGSLLGFTPPLPWGYLALLPEFIVPYVSLRLLSAATTKRDAHWREQLTEGMERGQEIQKVSILGFAKISEVRDPDTGDHILRMSHYSRLLAEEMGKVPENASYVTRSYIDEIYLSAPLHDIGKVGINDDILKKKGALTVAEFEIMKMHTILGGDLLHDLEMKLGFRTFYSLGKQIAYHHHQRYDGKGYPNVLGESRALFIDGGIGRPLQGNEIPLSARIVSLADVYDALISRRCYKEPIPHEQARQMILEDSGKRFDPEVVRAFQRVEKDFIRISGEFSR
jgi:HD-GYP domain-containing protein (c-di-GMP phosphodiesterase class II)